MKHHSFANAAVRLSGFKATTEFLEPIFTARNQELLAIVMCDDRTRLMEVLTFPGNESSIEVSINSVFRHALTIGATGLIVAHNHPSGKATPSKEDLTFTRKVAHGCEALDLTLVDHLIFGSGPVTSLRRLGLL